MGSIWLKNALVVNEGVRQYLDILIKGDVIDAIRPSSPLPFDNTAEIVDLTGKLLIPGVIDDQVHLREPGLTHKETIKDGSLAAAAGGVTSFMEMPNTKPPTTNLDELQKKFEIASKDSLVNYSFYFGATNDNSEFIGGLDPKTVCGVKVFMGSSTGNMLVDDTKSLSAIFAESPILVATHCEEESIIQKNLHDYKLKYGENLPFSMHPQIRSHEACIRSTDKAVTLATKYGTRLHVLHLSTAEELSLFTTSKLEEKKITGEVCVHHLWFNDTYYPNLGAKIKWNPAIKSEKDRLALIQGLINGKLDVVATDHAPHTLAEKNQSYFQSPSGGPLLQHSLVAMLELAKQGYLSLEQVVEKMCHNPAIAFQIAKRGFIRKGYFADLAVVDIESPWTVTPQNIVYKCGWSPFENIHFSSKITHTFINGKLVYHNGQYAHTENTPAMALTFNR
mgnify:CR=1 FL=1|jgi:dihydroorotase, multifunctional complex type